MCNGVEVPPAGAPGDRPNPWYAAAVELLWLGAETEHMNIPLSL